MNARRLLPVFVCSTAALGLSACGMFSAKPERPVAATSTQEFDPYSNTWATSSRVVTPPPSQPNASLAEQQAQEKKESGTLSKAGRAMSNTASAVGRAVKKPLGWFKKKDDGTVDDAPPSNVP
jgi:hypothetical protein